jgi:hypothetical protein
VSNKKKSARTECAAIKVRQWLTEWDKSNFNKKEFQARPAPDFYLFAVPASDLKALTGVYRRSARGGTPRILDPNVQRGHEENRSKTIREFVRFGYPWCDMSETKRELPDYQDLRKPGWLPTAIIVNILMRDDTRNGKRVADDDLITISERNGGTLLSLPRGFSGIGWQPKSIYPLEVIDGQHRLWAFEDFDAGKDFELPVVAFHGLDRGWQAYLFWSINITPKRINRSLAFDLYPLLRQQQWLDKFAGHSIYRETRCQELVESLWSHPLSPWQHRINMLGETSEQLGTRASMVSQAAWIRSLMATFVKQWDGSGGLFGAPRALNEPFLPWNRPMQAAFLIFVGISLRDAINKSSSQWAKHLRRKGSEDLFEANDDPAFYGKYSLLTTDQGIRGVLAVFNDFCFAQSDRLKLNDWKMEDLYAGKKVTSVPATEEEAVSTAVESIDEQPFASFVQTIAKTLSTYDWRTSSTPGLTEDERLRQAVFRGSSGYRELRQQLITHLSNGPESISKIARKIAQSLGE